MSLVNRRQHTKSLEKYTKAQLTNNLVVVEILEPWDRDEDGAVVAKRVNRLGEDDCASRVQLISPSR